MQADTGYAFECGNTDAGYCFAWKRSEVFAGLEIKLRMKNLVTRKGKKKKCGRHFVFSKIYRELKYK